MNEAMQKLVDAVQKASPVVWRAAYRQVWIDGVENLLLLIACLTGGWLLWRFGQKLTNDDAAEAGIFFARLGAVLAWVFILPCAISAFDCFANPTFAAIKELKGLL